MNAIQALTTRRSYRGTYTDTPVPREDLQRIMEAGLAAPSGCNLQTTSLVGVDDPEVLRELNTLLKKPNMAGAPAAICVLTKPEISPAGVSFHVQDYSAAIENMLLAAHALGYASCWVEGYVRGNIGEQMLKVLRIPEGYVFAAFLPIGVPAEDVQAPAFKPFAQRAWFNRERD
ncbi:MAG: nitroreductase family protein [Christensenellales bacterium]|jgi:nitroreductase